MKISTVLTIALGLISFIATAEFGFTTYSAAKNRQIVGQIGKLVETRGKWYEALTSLSTERSLSQVLLASPETGYESIVDLRAQQSAGTDALFAEARAKLEEAGEFPVRVGLVGDIDVSMKAIAGHRAAIDALLAKPLESRDPQVVTTTINNLKEEITNMKAMATHMVAPNSVTSAVTILLGDLQNQAFIMREYGGRARSLYAVATLHGETLTAEEHDYVHAMIDRVDEAWLEIGHISDTLEVPETVRAQLALVEKGMIQDFKSSLDALDAQMAKFDAEHGADAGADGAGTAAELPPVTFDVTFAQFFENSTNSLITASDLSIITGKALTDIWADKAADEQRNMIIDIAGLITIICLVGATLWVASRKISRRLELGLAELAAITAGDLNRDINGNPRDLQEMQQLSAGLANLQGQLRIAATAQAELASAEAAQQHVVSRLTEGLNSLAAGDLSQRITDRFDPKYQGLADNFNAATAALGDLVARVIDTANSILSGARGISEATTELSQRTETQGVTLQNAAAALEQLTRNIVGSQADATELDALASLASEKGNGMGATMSHTVAAMEAIKTSSQQIEQIVGVIEDIAFQTNLLALNAGVEATRAGAEGSGFAVIASEVRGLAERSAQSAQDIKALIAASGVEVAKGVEYVAEAEASAGDISEHIQKISGLISRIAVAATEQSAGLVKVNDGVSQLDLVTQTNVAMVEETTAECASLTTVAQDLSQLVSRFQITQTQSSDYETAWRAA